MRSFLYVSDLPRRAITVAQQAIEDDSEFRTRVAARASEATVGRAGYLWLTRPIGWAQEFELLTADEDDDATIGGGLLPDGPGALDDAVETGDLPLGSPFELGSTRDHGLADGPDPVDDADPLDDADAVGDRVGDEVGDRVDDEVEAAGNETDAPDDDRSTEDGGDADEGSLVDEIDLTGVTTAEPDPEIEAVYDRLTSGPVELVKAQGPDPIEPDYSFDPGDTFSPESPPIADAPMATVSPIGGLDDAASDPPPPSFELASLGIAAVSDRANFEAPPEEQNFTSFPDAESVLVETTELDFEADALESELSSLRGLVDRLAGERETVLSSVATPETPQDEVPSDDRALESEILALESDLESARHELSIAQADLTTARSEREEAQRLHSETLKRQVDLEKELATAREQRVDVENQASEAQVSVISLEDKLARTQSQLDEAERERKVVKSQLETMTAERNQIREDRIAIKAERDELHTRITDVEEKTGGVDVGELTSANKSLTSELEITSRELARMIAQAESFEEQIKTTTANADSLKTEKVELTSRLADAELALETTTTQHEALKVDSERLAAEVGTLRAERDGLQSQLTELQASLADVLNEQAEIRQRNDADRAALNELRVERDVLMARMNDLEAADRDYESRINSLVRERDDLVTARDELINERGQLRGEAAATVAEKDQLNEKLRGVEAKIGPLETELQAERRQREELATRLLELDDIAEQNAAELVRLTEDREAMSTKLDDQQAELVTAAEVRVERDKLTSQLTEAESRAADEAARNREKLAEMSEKLAAAETARTSLEQQLAQTTGELDTMRLDYEEAAKEMARLAVFEDMAKAAKNAPTPLVSPAEAPATETAPAAKDGAERPDPSDGEAQVPAADEAKADAGPDAKTDDAKTGDAKTDEAAKADAASPASDTDTDTDPKTETTDGADEPVPAGAAGSAAAGTETEDRADAPAADHGDDTPAEDITKPLGVGAAPSLLDAPAAADKTADDAAAKADGGDDAKVRPLALPPLQDAGRTPLTPPSQFDWPPPGKETDATQTPGPTVEIPALSQPPAPPAGLAPGAVGAGADADEEVDDLDEVSELIAKTVSEFNDENGLGTVTPLSAEAGEEVDLTLPPSDLVPDADKADGATEDTTQVLPKIAPPSIFGDDAKADRPGAGVTAGAPGGSGTAHKRRQIEVPSDILDDEVAVAQFVVSSPDVVLLVDGDSVAKLGWPSLPVAQQRDALVTYLADLSASSGAAPDVVFDGRIGDDDSLPASRAVRIRLSTPPTEPAAALDELVDAYPDQWPIALVTDDTTLAGSAAERGAAVLNNGQLLDLFIAQ